MVDMAVYAARSAAMAGNSPIAALAVGGDGFVWETAQNSQWTSGDVTAHAELQLLRTLAARGVDASTVWVVSNAEPCSMCASAMVKARCVGVVFGAAAEPSMDPPIGVAAVAAVSKHSLVVVGPVDQDRCAVQIAQGRVTAMNVRNLAVAET